MVSNPEQLVASSDAMLLNGRGHMCSRAEYKHSLNAMTQVLHTTVSSGETGTLDKRSSHDFNTEMRPSRLQLSPRGGETTLQRFLFRCQRYLGNSLPMPAPWVPGPEIEAVVNLPASMPRTKLRSLAGLCSITTHRDKAQPRNL